MDWEIDKLITALNNSKNGIKNALFCGAGISYNSGLPLVNNLIKKILESMGVETSEIEMVLNSDLPFEAFIETIHREVSIDEILDIFDIGEPNTNHELIAELIGKGLIKTVVTTNFDRLIEKALINKSLFPGTHFTVYATEEQYSNIDWNDSEVKIIKLHGCVSDKKEMAITLQAVANKAICRNKNSIIDNFFSKDINENIIVMGYSCSDLFDISPQVERSVENTSEIYFIEHSSKADDYTFEDICHKEYKNPFKKYSGKRIFIDTDYLVKKLMEPILVNPYHNTKQSAFWTDYVDNWLVKAIETNTTGVIYHLPGRLFHNIGEFNTAIGYYEKGIAAAQKDGNQIMFFSEMGNLGMSLNALGRYQEAKRNLEEALNASGSLGNRHGEISQLQALGNVYKNMGLYKEAIVKYKLAVLLSEKEDSFSLCTSLGNLASVFNQTDQPDETITYASKGIEIARLIGNKQSEGSMLSMLGIANFQKGNREQALKLMLEGIQTQKSIGDIRGECMSLQNLANAYLEMGFPDESIMYAESALEIAKSISIKQSEGAAHYIIGISLYSKRDFRKAYYNLQQGLNIFRDIYGDNHPHTQAAINLISIISQYIQ